MKETDIRGRDNERSFAQVIRKTGGYCHKASVFDDRVRHIDFYCRHPMMNGQMVSVECKSMKKLQRSDPKPNPDMVFLEIRGVPQPNGDMNKGWLFGGHADFIAFQHTHGYYLFLRRHLIIIADKIYQSNIWCEHSHQALEKLYARKHLNGYRGDIVTYVSLSKLINCFPHHFIGYHERNESFTKTK